MRPYHHHEKVWGSKDVSRGEARCKLSFTNFPGEAVRETISSQLSQKYYSTSQKVVVAMVKKTSTSLGTLSLDPCIPKKHIHMTTSLEKNMLLKSEPDFFWRHEHSHFPNKKCLKSAPLGLKSSRSIQS